MEKNLVIVESPAKAKTIEKFLGKDFQVMSSYGHIRDLKKKDFSIDIENNFEPIYEVPTDKKKVVTELKAASKKLRDPKCTIRKKFLDKLSEMGLNDASQIATLKESKRAKLRELENIRVLQRELTAGRLPF